VLLTKGEDDLLRWSTSTSRRVWVGIGALLMAVTLVFVPASTLGYLK
jgi:hypothetical protein